MDYLLLRIIQQYYMKTMLHVLRKSNEDILKAMIKISVFTDIPVIGFYGYIGDISVDIST